MFCRNLTKIEIPDRAMSNRMIDRAMRDRSACRKSIGASMLLRLNSTEPRCFAPRVDPLTNGQAYGKLALPKLKEELRCRDGNIVRQAVATIADMAFNPEEAVRIIQLGMAERLANLLISEDPYLRERVAVIYATISRQTAGREAIFRCSKIIDNLRKGLLDPLDAVRIQIARVVEILARHTIGAERDNLCASGFLEVLVDLIESEKNNIILAVHLESFESLLDGCTEIRDTEVKTMEKLIPLLSNEDETIVAGGLSCLSILSQRSVAKQMFIKLLPTLKKLLDSPRSSVYKKAATLVVFATTTTAGKLRAFELEMTERLVELACNSKDPELRIISIQALTNIGQVPDGKSHILQEHSMFIEDIDSRGKPETIEKHKCILLKIIRS